MSSEPSPSFFRRFFGLFATIVFFAGLTLAVVALLMNIQQRKEEAKEHFLKITDLDENSNDPELWKANFPRQYDGYLRTADMTRARHSGSDAIDKLEENPLLRVMYAGYAFSIDFREKRGHAYMLTDQENTERVKQKKQPGACLHCHAAVIPVYREQGGGDVMKGFEKVCGMPWSDAHKLVHGTVTCLDCHEPKTAELRVTRPAFFVGIRALAKSDDPVPHLPSIERWRKGNRKEEYEPNKMATRQELRSFACAQCHVEYYFKPDTSVLTYPWAKGLKVEQIEAYYDDIGFKDWEHKLTKAPMLKAQHPEFETWSQGIHARSGVSCADCHMPYKRDGAVKISDHHVRSPMLNINRACQTCHRYSDDEIKARVQAIQGRTKYLLMKAETAVVDLIGSIQEAEKKGVDAKKLDAARKLHRRSQWRADFVGSENSLGFHAGQESARVLGDAIDYARQGQLLLLKND
jgi:nitrite reductase (cytochrome c-552)